MMKSKYIMGIGPISLILGLSTAYSVNDLKKSEAVNHIEVDASEVLPKNKNISPKESLEASAPHLNLEQLKADLSIDFEAPNILKEDILRRWYFGTKEEKKFGTPDEWIFIDDGEQARWVSPDAVEESHNYNLRDLCMATAGRVVESCLKSSGISCQLIEEAQCECAEGTKWKDEQGCILTNTEGLYISLNQSELAQGFYLGLPNQKKLNTPDDWGWVEAGKNSAWRK